jgi:predicted permease
LIRSFQGLHSINLGFQKESLLEITLSPKPGGYQGVDLNSYHQQLLAHIADLPGVRAVSLGPDPIPNPQSYRENVSRASDDPNKGVRVLASSFEVSPDFFRTLGIKLLRGRGFTPNDDPRHSGVVVINNNLAKILFPGGDPVGQHIRFGFMPAFQNLEVIGLASDARLFDLREPAAPVAYLPVLQHPDYSDRGILFARTDQAPEAMARTIGQKIESLGREYALRTKTASQVVSEVLVEERVMAMLSTFFAALALVLASIGLYGLMSYAVTRRTREIGTRVALGAQQHNILWIVLRETLALTLLGIAIGVPCALAASRLIASTLFSVSSHDLATLAAVCLLLVAVALLAGYLPARRASAIDPIIALRTE